MIIFLPVVRRKVAINFTKNHLHLSFFKNSLWGIVLIAFLSSCSIVLDQPIKRKEPTLGQVTTSEKRLNQLPPPRDKIVAAVYSFRDKTGQYKLTETGGSWSTAVTQGANSILIKALEESGWFTPIEREGLGNLLNERKIIRSSRAHYNKEGTNSQSLPPLLFGGIILEGGIISYDHNVQTGGLGLRYFGSGASTDYRQDRVTVYLRAISTKNGKILKTVNATKTILSQKIDAGVFRYVKFKRLLEAETGITYNEPTEIAVKEAIEKSVESLIIEGLFSDLWDLKNPEKINSDIIQTYVQDKVTNENTTLFGINEKTRSYSYSVKAEGGINKYAGDYSHSIMQWVFDLNLGYDFNQNFGAYLNFGKYSLAAKNRLDQQYDYLNIGALYRLTPQKPSTIFFKSAIGASINSSYTSNYLEYNRSTVFPQINAGAGVEFLIGEQRKISISPSVNINYFFNDRADKVKYGYMNDYYWEGKIGVGYYF